MKEKQLQLDFRIPNEILKISETLKKAGYEAYLIGGCVRDLFLKRIPKDWDITTNATPEEIIALFSKTFYENIYGTVGVVNEETEDETLKVVEVTPYRTESTYTDNRHPDKVVFSHKIEDDLSRRDFTINAIALGVDKDFKDTYKGQVIDLYSGMEDLKAKIIRTVGEADERFREDALRIIRCVRLSTELGFMINLETQKAIEKNKDLLGSIAKERIRDEFIRIIMSDRPLEGIFMAQKFGILKYIVPELEESVGIDQNQAHAYTVFEHLLRTLQHAADKKWPLELRLAALFHDVGKPKTRRKNEKGEWTFYGHEVVGARMTAKIMASLRFPKKTIDDVVRLVRWHMFFSDTDQITLSAVRRMIANVGKENVWTLMNLRICDRIGTGRPKEDPYRLRKYKAMIEEVLHDPISVSMLKIDGKRIMEVAKTNPGPKIGHILHILLEEVLEDPLKNNEEYLEKKAAELMNMDEKELKSIGDMGRKKKEELEEKEIQEIRKKYWVK